MSQLPPQHPLMRYFDFLHLPVHLQNVSKYYFVLADYMDKMLPDGAEKTTALRKLLESKDAAVRAAMDLPKVGE